MTYRSSFYQNPADFLDRTLKTLAKDETKNNLILGLALRLKENPQAYSKLSPLMLSVSDENGKLCALGLMTLPFAMVVQSEPLNQEALEVLALDLQLEGWELPGVNGEAEVSDAFARIWQSKTKQKAELIERLRAYELRELKEIDYPAGKMRIAEEKDAQMACHMLNAMQAESVPGPRRELTVEGSLESIRKQQSFFWEVEGEIVASLLAKRPQIKGICISGVYTLPEHRRKGYARALVAEASKEMLRRGYEFTNLFTDLDNPTSNKIYQEVGYRPVCDYHLFSFKGN